MTDAMDPIGMVVRGYDDLAHRYDQWADTVDPPLRNRYVDWLDARLDPGSHVLELGSGTGRMAERLALRYRYLGVDASEGMVAVARARVPTADFVVTDMREVDQPLDTLDAVVAFYSIIHVPREDHPCLFERIHQWLRPGGYFVACLSSEDLVAGVEDDWLGAGPMYWSGYDAETYRRMLRKTGFDEIQAKVVTQIEGDEEVRFLWFIGRRPPASSL